MLFELKLEERMNKLWCAGEEQRKRHNIEVDHPGFLYILS